MYCGGQETNLETAVYLSTAVHEMTPVALHGLLAKARENNRANGVTGALLYAEGGFIQVLEGPSDRLTETLARIERDCRHKSMLVLYRGAIEERGFPDWSMGYRNAEADASSIFALTNQTVSDLDNGRIGREVLILLKQFYASAYPHTVA